MRKFRRGVLCASVMYCLVLFMAALGSPSSGGAQTLRDGEVAEVMTYVTAPGKERAFEEARSAMFRFLKTQSGFVSVTGRQDLKDPKVHVDLSVWASRAQYNAASSALPEKLRSAFMGTVSEWKYFGLVQ